MDFTWLAVVVLSNKLTTYGTECDEEARGMLWSTFFSNLHKPNRESGTDEAVMWTRAK